MPSRRPDPDPQQGTNFPEAVAQWRLALRTEVKSASSLPTAMFLSRDAMLEALLVEATEPMLAQLQEPQAAVAADDEHAEKRIETVLPAELRALPGLVQDAGDGPLGLDDHLAAESLAVLTDICCGACPVAAQGAAALLLQHFDLRADEPAPAMAARLLAGLQAALGPDTGADALLADICQRIAATVAATTAGAMPDGGQP